MSNINIKHTLTSIVETELDQDSFKKAKEKISGAFNEIRAMVEADVDSQTIQECVDLLNKAFKKVGKPTIDISDLQGDLLKVQTSFEQVIALINNIDIASFNKIETSLEHISTQVDRIVDKIGSGVKKSVNTAIASVEKLDKTLSKLGDPRREIEDTLNYTNGGTTKTQNNNVKKLLSEYQKLEAEFIEVRSAGGAEDVEHWFKRQQAIIKYVKAYEDYYTSLKNKKNVNVEYETLYNKLVPKAFDARTNFQNLYDRRSGTYSPQSEPWAREDTLKEVRDILKGGIKVSGQEAPSGDNNGTEKPRKSNPRTNTEIRVYRGIFPPEDEDISLSRDEIKRNSGGGEWWTNKKGVAQTYADLSEGGVILVGTISPKNPLIIDAGGHQFDEFSKMPGFNTEEFKRDFADIFAGIQTGKFKTSDDVQAAINARASELGYDVVEFRNVLDTMNPRYFSELSSVFSVLDDSALKVNKAFNQLAYDTHEGIGDYSRVASEALPEYYKPPIAGQEDDVEEVAEAARIAADETQRRSTSEGEITKEIEKQNKLLLYRRVEGDLDPNRISGFSADALYNGENQPNINEALQYGFGGFGDGLYASTLSGAEDIARTMGENDVTFFEFDASDYKFYINKTAEQAEFLRQYLLSLQKFVGAGTILDVSTLTEIEDFSEDELFKLAQKLFEDFNMTQEQFHLWIENAKAECANMANLFAEGKVPDNYHNFGTRFMQTLGYDGVLNSTGYDMYDGEEQGSVIFNPDVNKITATMKVFKNQAEYLEHIRAIAQTVEDEVGDIGDAHRENADAIDEEVRAQERLQKITKSDVSDVTSSDISSEPVSGDTKSSVDIEALKGALSAITYNVRVVQDGENSDTKISIDEASLEGVLNRVFSNILNPQTQQNDSEIQNQPWALESTLQSVKSVLDQIQTNTTKFESTALVPIDTSVENALATESTLTAIKTAVEAINTKIAKGVVVSAVGGRTKSSTNAGGLMPYEGGNSDNGLVPYGDRSSGAGTHSDKSDKLLADIAVQRKKLEEFTVKLRESGKLTDEYQTWINNLTEFLDKVTSSGDMAIWKKAFDYTRTSVRIDDAETKNARQMAKREAMLGRAGGAVSRGENAWMNANAVDFDGDASFIDEYYEKLDALRKKHQELKNSNFISDEDKADIIAQTIELNKLTGEMEEFIRLSGSNATVMGASSLSTDAGLDDYEAELKRTVNAFTNGKAQIKGFNAETKTLTYVVKTGKNEFTEYTAAVRHADGQLVTLQGTTKRTETFLEATKRKIKEISSYISGMALFSRLGQELRRGIQYVREIDLALTELRKVTDETEETYDRFLETASKTAEKVGSTIRDVISSTADWARLGYSMKEAAELAESTQILMNVSEFTDVNQATDSLISSIQAFRYTAEESMDVVDILNTIGNNYAISTADLAQSLTKSSGSLVAANGTLEEAVALTAAANTIIQDADVVGTALKTVAMRLRGTSITELEEEGLDTDGAIESISKLQSKIQAISGVNILTDTGAYKSTYQILSEIADVWENINDMEQAALLELLAGKRAGSTMAAILQNPEILKDAFESASEAEGSALKENEKYLDSIQGRIDQFNNAMQSMWSDALEDDMVKGIVNLGTEIIKIIDDLGLLNSALLAFGAYKGLGAIFGTLKDSGITISSLTKKLGAYLFGIETTAAAEAKLTQVELQNKLVKQGLTEENAKAIIAQTGLGVSTENLSRETFEATMAELGYDSAIIKTTADKIFGTTVTNASAGALLKETIQRNLANSALVKFAIQLKLATAEQVANMTINQLLGLSFKALGTAIWGATKAIAAFLFTNPVGWIILAVGAIAGGIAIFNHFHKTTEELTEELGELKNELQDIQSEVETVNSELETMEDRMAELLAKDSLSFVEQEELDRLQKENNELQRKLDLLKEEEKIKAKEAGKKFVETMKSYQDASYNRNGKMNWWQRLWADDTNPSNTDSQKEYITQLMEEYDKVNKVNNGELDRSALIDEMDADWYSNRLGEEVKALVDAADDIKYYVGDNLTDEQKELNEWLDYVYNTQDKLAILRGGENAKTNALNRIFDKDENSDISDSIDEYVEALKNGDTNAKSSIENIINNNEALVEDLEASGLSVDAAVDYFTAFASELEFATLEGKIAEIGKAATNFESLLKGNLFNVDGIDIGLADLFDEEGKIIQTKLSQVFQGTSEQTREDITNLLEKSYDQIKNGTADVENLLSGFALKTTQQVLEIQNKILGEQNLELFPNLKDEIDGIIDKFSEFSAAVGSVVDAMDTLEQARAEEAYSGSISIETLENLMKYTDDYAQLVEIDETGAIRLAADAEKILIEQRIQKIKTDAAAAVQTAQTNLEQAKYNAKAVNETGPVQEALTSATDGLAGAWAYLGSIIGDVTDGNFSGMFDRASAAYGSVTAGREEKRAQVNVSVEDAEEALANALNQQNIADALTSDNVKSKHSSDEASGGADTKKEAEKNLIEEGWDKLVSEYENKLALITNERDLIQAEIDKMEAQGGKASAQYYEDLIRNSEEEKALLAEKLAAQQAYLDANKANMDQDTWTEYNNEINETAVAIKECEVNTLEWVEALREIDTHYFEQITDEVSRLGEELEFVNSLLEDEEVADENGNWSSAALTRIGLYTQQMEKAAAEAKLYQDEIDKLNSQYEDGVLSEEQYQEALSNLVSGQQDAIMSYEDAKNSIVEMNEARVDAIKEGIEKEIEAYEDLIEAKKEELDAERDLHDFRENIKDQTKEISDLERRIAGLSGSSAASDIAERRRLEAELMRAKEGLNDTYYDHSRDAQSQALDEESEAFQLSKERYIEQLEEQLKDAETLIENSIMDVMLNADTVYNELINLSDIYGVTLSDSLTLPWKDASAQAIAWKDELKESMTSGEYAALIGEGGAITAFANGVATKLQGSWTKAQTAAQNYAGYLTGEELRNKFSNTLTGFGNQIQVIIDKWNGVKRAADDAYTAQTRQVTVGGTGSGATGSGSGNGGGSGSNGNAQYTVPTMHASGKNSSHIRIGKKTDALSKNKKTIGGVEYYLWSDGYYYPMSAFRVVTTDIDERGKKTSVWGFPANTNRYKYYAKGTLGTKRDGLAITDEPWLGNELVLVPGADGNLQYMRAGTAVMPADISANLVKWGKLDPSMLNLTDPAGNINLINNSVNKPEFNLTFDALVKADKIDENTLPEVKKFVKQEIDGLVKQMNYALKGKGAR